MKLILFFCLGIILSSCDNKSTVSKEEIEQIIIKKCENMRTSLKNGDPNYVLNMHANDAILFTQNGKEVKGIIELRPFYEKVAATGVDIKSSPTAIEFLSEDMVYEVGTFTSTSKTGIENSAKYINIWKSVKGDWKIVKAIDHAKL